MNPSYHKSVKLAHDLGPIATLFWEGPKFQYRIALERWHQSRREMSHLVQPFPEPPQGLDTATADKIRDEVKREQMREF